MNKKVIKKTGTRKRTFRNLEDISQFENELVQKEMASMGIKYTETQVPNNKYRLNSYYYDQKKKTYIRINPNNPEEIKYVTQKGMVSGTKQIKSDLQEISEQLAQNQELSYQLETDPIVFSSKGKTPLSVPYLRVFIESSLGESESIHFVHNKTKKF